MNQFNFKAIACGVLGTALLLGTVALLSLTSCKKQDPEEGPDEPGIVKLTPEEDVVFPWDYKYYDDIDDRYVPKVWVDGVRDWFVGSGLTIETWNAASKTIYTQTPPGAITKHTDDDHRIDITLVSKAAYGISDSTYVYSIKRKDSEGVEHIGRFKYVVKARPSDAVIDLGTFDKTVAVGGEVTIAVGAIKAVYDSQKDFYANYTFPEVLAAFAANVKIDSFKVTVGGKVEEDIPVFCKFGYSGGEETTYISLPMEKAGKWKVQIFTHFANVAYTFTVKINPRS